MRRFLAVVLVAIVGAGAGCRGPVSDRLLADVSSRIPSSTTMGDTNVVRDGRGAVEQHAVEKEPT